MSETESLREAAKTIREQIDQKVAAIKSDPVMMDVLKLQTALNTLEGLMGEPSTSLAHLFGMQDEASTAMRPDEFYGLSALDAAKKYLEKRGEARPFNEIVEAIRAGGGKVESEEDLKLSLARSTYEVAKVNENTYGLVKFYAHVKRGRKRKGESEAQDADTDHEDLADVGEGTVPFVAAASADSKAMKK